MKSNWQNASPDRTVITNGSPPRGLHFSSSGPAADEPHAVFALGNFFGDGDVFVAIPWQSLQLARPSKSLNINVFPVGAMPHKSRHTNAALLEIKRDASGCIQVTARKTPD